MKKVFFRIVSAVLLSASLSACGAVTPDPSTYTPSPPIASQTAEPSPTKDPTPIPATETSVPHPGWTTYPEVRSIRDMVFDQKGSLWAIGPAGVVQIQPDGSQSRFHVEDGLPGNDLLSVGVDSQGAVWVGSRENGVARFDGKDWQTFTAADGLAGNEVFSIVLYAGTEGVLFGTQKGLSVYNGSWASFAGPDYLPDDKISSIASYPGGSIWIGTQKGAMLFGPSETYTTVDGLASDVVNAMAIAPDCSLWLGTGGGVSHYEQETWTSYTVANGLAAGWVSAAAVTLDGVAWFGTRSGVSRFDGKTWSSFTTADGLAEDDVLSIAVAPDDSLWFGTAGGLSHYVPALGAPSTQAGEVMEHTSNVEVVYQKDGNAWLWEAGVNHPLTSDGRVSSVKLSGDGSQVAFTRWNGDLENELWVINRDGSGERLLVGPDHLALIGELTENEWTRKWDMKVVIFHYDWVPGGHTLAYGTRRQVNGPGTLYHDDLQLVDAETGESRTLLPPGRGGRFFYSPDGSQVAIVTPTHLSIMDADGSNMRANVLEYPSVAAYSEAEYYPSPVWSADSQSMRLALPPEDPLATPQQPTTLWHIPADGSPAARLGSISPTNLLALSVAFSPDLAKVAYLTETEQPAEYQLSLHIANSDGTGDRVVQEGPKIRFSSWSLDGQHYLYYTYGNPKTWTISTLAGESIPLPFSPENLAWVSGDVFLHVEDLGCAQELRLTSLTGESVVIARMWKLPVSFDFIDGMEG